MNIKNKIGKFLCLFLIIINIAIPMAGCSSKFDVSNSTEKPVTLKMYLIGDKPRDFDEVYDKVNEKMKEKINTTLDVKFIPLDNINDEYEALFKNGENFDLIFTATNWCYYNEIATKDGFYELSEDMIKEYAPNIYKNEPNIAWKQAKVDGKIYMVPSDQIEYSNNLFAVRGDLMKKYGIDTISNYDELEDYMDAVVEDKNSGVKNLINSRIDNLKYVYFIQKNNFREVAGTPETSIIFDINNNDGSVIKFIDSPEYLEYAKKMKEFKDKGYWSDKDIGVEDSRDKEFMQGNTAMMQWDLFNVADRASRLNKKNPEYDVRVIDQSFGKNKVINPFTNNGIAINSLSKNPHRALMALDLLRYDKEIYDLTWYGIEGKHYKDNNDNTYTALNESEGFPIGNVCPWGWYSERNAMHPSDESKEVKDIYTRWKKNETVTNPILAFSFDDSKVKSECENVKRVMNDLGKDIDFGLNDDVEKSVGEYRNKLNKAGLDNIYKECQKQLNEYIYNYKNFN